VVCYQDNRALIWTNHIQQQWRCPLNQKLSNATHIAAIQDITKLLVIRYIHNYLQKAYVLLFFKSVICNCLFHHIHLLSLHVQIWGRRGRDRMVVGFITYAISAHHKSRFEFESPSGDLYSMQHYVIKIISYLRKVDGFLWVLRFHPSIKVIATI
jgi:hypothetical protein